MLDDQQRKRAFNAIIITQCLGMLAGALVNAVTGANAEPVGNMATPINYLVVAKDLHAFGTGVYGGTTERSVSAEGYAGIRDLKSDEVMAYISYYPLNWLSAYVAAGYGRFELTGGRDGKSDILVTGWLKETDPHCPVGNFCAALATGRVGLYGPDYSQQR